MNLHDVQEVRVLECPVLAIPDDETAAQLLVDVVNRGHGGYSVAINAEKIMMYRRDPGMRAIIDGAHLLWPDGAGAAAAINWLHQLKAGRLDFPMIALSAADQNGWRVFVMGATEEVNARAYSRIEGLFPGATLVGRANGFISDEEKIQRVSKSDAELLILALGSPQQERFARFLYHRGLPIFSVSCGGALDILSGKTQRAPTFIQKNSLEWLYRLIKQPTRWRRQKVLIPFLLYLLQARFFKTLL